MQTTTKTSALRTNVAWTMFDGNTMAGVVTFVGLDTFLVRRVDGGMCEVAKSLTHPASSNEVLAACRFFTRR